jgi:DeoR/GlpR family transcriptional regulator of sugar metabolism
MGVVRQIERDQELYRLLRSQGQASVDELAAELQVSSATIRRDLRRLSEDGRIVRTYGGALLPGQAGADPGAVGLDEKRRIGAAAADLVRDGQSIVVASGTTPLELARRLTGRQGLTVITTALDVCQVLLDQEGIELIVLGGVMRPSIHSLLGHLTDLAAAELRADTMFMGIGAISPELGLMNDYVPEILTDRALRRMARSLVVLADARKFDLVAPAWVFDLDAGDTLVTDARVRPASVAALEARGVHVIVA